MNKTALKNFAIWARKKLISDITYSAGLLAVNENSIGEPLPQSRSDLQLFDIGTKDYAEVKGERISQRNSLVSAIRAKAEELDNYLSAFLVALDDQDHVVGYAGLQAVLDEGYITNVAVRPDCRKQGVAGKLLQVFLDFAEGNHLAFLSLEVRASNYDAIALYGSRGFRSVGRRKNYYEHPREDAIIMTKEFEHHGTETPVS